MLNLEFFVANHPFWAYGILFGGMFIEGEAFVLTAIIFAWQGLMDWRLIAAVTFIGVMLGDIAWYFLGRLGQESKIGLWLKKKFPAYHEWMDKNFISRYSKMAFLCKFLYFVNRLTPLIAGWHKMEMRKFLKIHFMAAVLWLATMMVIGYLFGFIIEAAGARVIFKKMEWVFVGFAVIFITGEILLKKLFSKKIGKTLN
jgi:membrane-associated protein